METMLIVEDEKLIRQGLSVMMQRSGVPVGEILDCRNGEEALKILETTRVDVIFTDVRMPKMDGLTLIRKIAELDLPWPHPEIVVISGHDDFNYAVEAMHYGSREYILKPVKRERVTEVLLKLDDIIAQKKETSHMQEDYTKLCRQHLKYALADETLSAKEMETLRDTFGDLFPFVNYLFLCQNRDIRVTEDENAICLRRTSGFYIWAVNAGDAQSFIARNLPDACVGVSDVFHDVSDFRKAFDQSMDARKYAFFTGKRIVEPQLVSYIKEDHRPQYPFSQLARWVGSKEYPALVRLLDGFFMQAARARVFPGLFEDFMLSFYAAVADMFSHFLPPDAEGCRANDIYTSDTVDDYRIAFFQWLDGLHARICLEMESSRSAERMQEAIVFIEENYHKSLNMAVVSNHISMNYSVFSQLFKEHTGQSFVDYLRSLRIAKASDLLKHTDLRISEISARIGFDSDKYFMRSFKAIVGISPTQFRKIERTKQQ